VTFDLGPVTFDPEIRFCSVMQISDSVFAGLDKCVLHGNDRVLQAFPFALILYYIIEHIPAFVLTNALHLVFLVFPGKLHKNGGHS
jgi:hypothetical protein